MAGNLGGALAVLAGALGGGATRYGEALDERDKDARQKALEALQIASTNQQMQQGSETHALGVLNAIAPFGRIARGTAPAPAPAISAPSAPFQTPAAPGAPGSGLAALAGAGSMVRAPGSQPGGLAALGAKPAVLQAGDAPDRYVQAGPFYTDTAKLDPKTEREIAMNHATHAALVNALGEDAVGPFAPGVNYGQQYMDLLKDRTTRQANTETGRHNAAEEKLGFGNLGVAQGNLGVARGQLGISQGSLGLSQNQFLETIRHNKVDEQNAALTAGGGAKTKEVGQTMATVRQLLDNYQRELEQSGTMAYAGGDPAGARLTSAHTAVALNLKNLHQLGALSESDLKLMTDELSPAVGLGAKLKGSAPILAQLEQVRRSLGATGNAYGVALPDPQTRAQQLKTAGFTPESAKRTMQAEGYDVH